MTRLENARAGNCAMAPWSSFSHLGSITLFLYQGFELSEEERFSELKSLRNCVFKNVRLSNYQNADVFGRLEFQ